jgi:hypothetical protein
MVPINPCRNEPSRKSHDPRQSALIRVDPRQNAFRS